MGTLVRRTGLPALISFYRYFQLNLPRSTTAAGIALLLASVVIRLFWLSGHFLAPNPPAYVLAYLAVIVALNLVAAAMMVVPRLPIALLGWTLGAFVSTATVGIYIASRAPGLPDLPELVGRWDYPLGTVSLFVPVAFLALWFTVITQRNIAYPQQRGWHD